MGKTRVGHFSRASGTLTPSAPPVIAPGVIAGALCAFWTSFDELCRASGSFRPAGGQPSIA
jgi:hypothetical protein